MKKWPDANIEYEWPDLDSTNQAKWQEGLDSGLNSDHLRFEPTTSPSIFTLVGGCPRCGHDTTQEVHIRLIRSADRFRRNRPNTFNFDCACDFPHEGAGEGDKGCGWGGPLKVVARVGAEQ